MILTAQQTAWRDKAARFAREQVGPRSLEWDQRVEPQDSFDWDLVRSGSRLGLRTAVLPEEWGGESIDAVTQALVMTELARADSAVARTFAQAWRWSKLLLRIGTQDQHERFLRPFVADDTYLIGSSGTEPGAGSDHRIPIEDPRYGWKMSAERDGDDWVLNGTKRFIAQGNVARLFFTSTRTDASVPYRRGTTVFLVPSDAPGLRIGRIDDKLGWRFNQNAEMIFEDVRIPDANLVGEVNDGVNAKSGHIYDSDVGEVGIAALALGVCEAAIEMSYAWARGVERGGSLLLTQQATRLKLSEMHMLTEALRSFVFRIAQETDNREDRDRRNNALVANFATDAVQRVTRLNVDIHGRDGLSRKVGAEKLARDAVIWTHLAGDTVNRLKAVKV